MPPAKKATKQKAAKKALPSARRRRRLRPSARQRSARLRRSARRPRRPPSARLPRSARRPRRPPSARHPRSARRPSARRPSARPRQAQGDRAQGRQEGGQDARRSARRRGARPRRRRPRSGRRSALRASAPPRSAEPVPRRSSRRARVHPGPSSRSRARRRARGLEVVDAAERLAGAHAGAQPGGLRGVVRLDGRTRRCCSSGRSSMPIVERHWLRCAQQRLDLAVDAAVDALDVVGAVRTRTATAAAGRCGARPCSGKKCGSRAATMPSIASSPAWRWSGWMRSIGHGSCPSTTSGRVRRITAHTARTGREAVVELAVDVAARNSTSRRAEDRRPRRAARPRRVAMQRARGRRRRPTCPWTPSVQTHRCTSAPRVGPLRERCAAAELDVVGVRADRERRGWRRRRGRSRQSRVGRRVMVQA